MDEREDPGALAFDVTEGGTEEMPIPNPLVVESREGAGLWMRGRRIWGASDEVVLKRVGEVVRVAGQTLELAIPIKAAWKKTDLK